MTDGRIILNLSPEPYAKPENLLKLAIKIVPPVVVAGGVCREVVVHRVHPSSAVGQYMVRMPLRVRNLSATHMTTTCCLRENDLALIRGQGDAARSCSG